VDATSKKNKLKAGFGSPFFLTKKRGLRKTQPPVGRKQLL